MVQYEATEIRGVEGAMLSDDGYNCLVKFAVPSGELIIAIPIEQVQSLATLLAGMASQGSLLEPGETGIVYRMPVDQWRVATSEGGNVVLSFQTHSEGTFSFALERDYAPPLAEAITVAARVGD